MRNIVHVIVLTLVTGAASASGITVGAGKALNNTNTSLPGWVYSVRGTLTRGPWSADVAYTHLGPSYLAENAAISTVGAGYRYGKARYGLSLITGGSYSAAVWWDAATPERTCGVEGCGIRYPNNGAVFSRACHLCGGSLSADYALSKHSSIRGEYFGLRHMEPTFQGVIVQLQYTIGAL